nr:gamma-tubulin complex component 2 [Cryptomonas curvata]
MDFFKLREAYSKNFKNTKKNEQFINQNIFSKWSLFFMIEKIIEKLINFKSTNAVKYILNCIKDKKIIKNFIQFSYKLEKTKIFIDFFKNQKYNFIISNLCYSFYIILNEFNLILFRFYLQIYNGWLNPKVIWNYLNSSKISIQICCKLIKIITKTQINSLFLLNYCYMKTIKKNCKQILYLIEYSLNFQFYLMINKLILFNNIEDYQGNFINLLRLKKKSNNRYHMILEKKLTNYQKKILKYAIIISFLLKNFFYLKKIIKFKKTLKNKFINVEQLKENKIKIFFKTCFLKIAKSICFFYQKKIFIIEIFKKILFFFCFFNGNLSNFTNLSTIYKKLNLLKKIFFKSENLTSSENLLGCFTIDFIDYSYSKLIGFYYFKNFFKSEKKNLYFPLNQFLNEYKFEKINLNCTLKWPYLCFISKNSIKKYRILGKYLFKIKIIENILINNWKTQNCNLHYFFLGSIRASLFLNQIFLSFFRSLLTYFLFHVLESNWNSFVKKVKKFNNMNSILMSHEYFLKDSIDQIYLNKPKISRLVIRLFAIAKLFTLFIKNFFNKQKIFFDDKKNVKKEKDFKIKTFSKKILIFKKNYYFQIIKLIKNLRIENKKNYYKYNFEKIINISQFFI